MMPKHKEYSYDSRCFDLAEVFLDGLTSSHEAREKLAQEIQDVIEDFCREYEPSEAEQGLIPIPGAYAEQ